MDNSQPLKGGRIFNIQRFCIHDGPGIRTVVFLKGCRLRCRWCCNPEAQCYDIQTLNGKTVGEDVTVEEVLVQLEKDRPYYNRSGGGITLSGGEALCQPDFCADLLNCCKQAGFHTAIETTGFAPFKDIQRCMQYIDLFLMDIKHMDSQKHQQFTTQPNQLILENAQKIARLHGNITIRVPVIPTFNDSPQEILAIAHFAASLPNVHRIHLLPYHRLGEDKYAGLGRQYTLSQIAPPPHQLMAELCQTVQSVGLDCQIGG